MMPFHCAGHRTIVFKINIIITSAYALHTMIMLALPPPPPPHRCVCPVLTPRPTVGRAAQASPPLPFPCCLLDTYVCTLYIMCTFTCLKVCGFSIKKLKKLTQHSLLPNSQFAYRKMHSTEDALVLATNVGCWPNKRVTTREDSPEATCCTSGTIM